MQTVILEVPPHGKFVHPTLGTEIENVCVLPMRITRFTETGMVILAEPDPYAELPPGTRYKKAIHDARGKLIGSVDCIVPRPAKTKRRPTPPDTRTGRERSLGPRRSR